MACNENTKAVTNKDESKGPFLGMRHMQAALMFLNIAVQNINRMHVAITLVAMTNANKSNPNFPEYNWDEQQKSYILSSFYLGYVFTSIPGAYFGRRFGVKFSLLLYTLCTGLLSLLVPFSTSWGGWQAFCLIRFFQGIFQGGVYPAFLQHLATWSPPQERSVLSGFAHTGFDCGVVVAIALGGVIATSSWGWPGIFYICAAFCFTWCGLWQLFGSNNVKTSRFITKAEVLFIENALENSINFQQERLPVPWRAIFTSKPFYALLAIRAPYISAYVTVLAEWPSYMNGVFKVNISDNSLYSALPGLASWVASYIFTFIAHLVSKRNSISVTTSRKCFNSFGIWSSAMGMILVGFLEESQKTFAITTMIIIFAVHSSTLMGSSVCAIDIAPNHTDIITSIINTVAQSMTFLGPLYVGIVVDNEQNREQWQIAFITIAVILCIGDLTFLIWGTAKEQPWNANNFWTAKKDNKQNVCTVLPVECKNEGFKVTATNGSSSKNLSVEEKNELHICSKL